MNTEQTEQQSLTISQEKLLAFFRAMIGGSRGREDDEQPLPPGPWDPVIRVALERINVFSPQPEPWRVFSPSPEPWKVIFASLLARHSEIWDAIGGGHRFGEEVALNPQPLPPRFAFLISLAQTVISRAELLQEIADAISRNDEQHGNSMASGYIARFADDCPTGKLKWLFRGPRPPWWFTRELDGIDLMVMAAQFEQSAKETFSQDLRQNLADASAKFVEVGLSRMR